jgi:hypothetical protein
LTLAKRPANNQEDGNPPVRGVPLMARQRWPALLVALPVLAALANLPATACPFCMEGGGPTLLGDYKLAEIVLLGTCTNARLTDANLGEGKTDVKIDHLFKGGALLNGKKTITIDKYLPNAKNKYLLFMDVYKGKLDPYKGIELTDATHITEYLNKAIKLKDAPIGDRLRICAEYLTSPDYDVSMDAYREFARADYKDYSEMAKTLKPEVIAGWLQDPKTPAYRYGLYGSLLGHCGTKEHGELLKSMIEDPKKVGTGIDGLLAGYLMISRDKGLEYLKGVLKNEREHFDLRYAALRTVRFFWDSGPPIFKKKDLSDAASLALKHFDMADLAIEDLRRWQCWDASSKILPLFSDKDYDLTVIRRAILRYALSCPNADAVEFVRQQRARDAAWVKDVEEILHLESDIQPGSKVVPTKKK